MTKKTLLIIKEHDYATLKVKVKTIMINIRIPTKQELNVNKLNESVRINSLIKQQLKKFQDLPLIKK